ncbi:hypothetical protein DSO57_1004011 [Entomophthora muscae]|uniref:Uncharacterized protein n=1 Tax=Entomophthora muscae TaxID=34485 RepID=A0ACC2SLQ7_9FUNG|nr:hypothetical protein DSO57_1004011 [Entomophthora muscae]
MITLYRNATRSTIFSRGWRTQSTSALAATESEMVGSVGFHRLHLGVLTAGDSWPVKFFEASDFHLSIFNMLKKGGIGLMRNTKITSFHSPWLLSPNIDSQNIVLFPLQLTLKLSKPGDFEELQQLLLECVKKGMKKDEAVEWIRKNTSLAPKFLDDKFSLIVCTHNEVDCRCGQIGSKIFDTLEEMRKDKPGVFSTFKSSHIGGHKFC